MSGGHFNYNDGDFKSSMFDYRDDFKSNPLEDLELSELLWDILTLIHDYDWYVSGDTGKEDWEAARKAFKAKWLGGSGRNERLERIIVERLKDVRDELRDIL